MVLPCIVTGLFVGLRTVYYSAWMVPMWAQVAFWASVTGLLSGLGTLLWKNYAMLVTRVATRWQNIKSQFGVEDMLTEDFVNHLVAGIAITGLLPIVAAIVYSLLRSDLRRLRKPLGCWYRHHRIAPYRGSHCLQPFAI